MHRYDVSDWQRHAWEWHKLEHPEARAGERAGEELWASDFGDFAEDTFHRMLEEAPARLPAQPGSELWDRLHAEIDAIPEVADLHARCVGDEGAAGIAAQVIVDTLVAKAPAPDVDPLGDPAADAETAESIRRMMAQHPAASPEHAAAQQVVDAVEAQAQQNAARNAHAASMMDGVAVRNALRAAAAAAQQAIDEAERVENAFSCGQGAHSSRRERRAVAQQVAPMLKQSARLRRIAELAGRLKRIARDQQARKPDHGADEYTGVELGADVERLLPAEWAASDDPDLEDWFYQKHAERALQQIELAAKPQKQRGPIVLLLDSSGSMRHNDAAEWAAAVAMAFLDIAVHQRRAFALVHFGGQVLRTDRFAANAKVDPAAVARAVDYFAADGGTNFMAALDAGLTECHTGEFANADIVMVTDGLAQVTSDMLGRVNGARRERGLHVYSILIGTEPQGSVNAQFSDEVVELGQVLRDDSAMHALFGAV